MTRDAAVVAAAAGLWAGAAALQLLTSAAAVGLAVVALCLGVAALRRRWLARPVALVLLVSVCAGWGSAGLRAWAETRSPLPDLAVSGAMVGADVRVLSDPRVLRDGSGESPALSQARIVVQARVEAIDLPSGRVALRQDTVVFAGPAWGDLVPGTLVRSTLGWFVGGSGAPMASARGEPQLVEPPGIVPATARALRDGLRDAAAQSDRPGAGLVPALVVGDERDVPEEVADALRGSGLTHLTAVSGANVAIVLGAVLGVAALLRVRGRALTVVGVVTLVAFGITAGPEPSVLRACAMGAIVLLAAIRGGTARSIAVLAAAVLALLVVDPALAVAWGFALSTAATAGIIALMPWVERAVPRQAPRPVARLIAASLAAQVAVAPVVAALAGRLDAGGVIANVLAEPAVAPTTVLGFAAALASVIDARVAAILASAAAFPADVIVFVARVVSSGRWAVLPWPSGVWGGLLMLVVLAAAGSAVYLMTISARAVRGRSRSVRPQAALALLLALIVVVGLPVRAEQSWPPPGWALVMCDVGQGDAFVLNLGDGSVVVVDTGPDVRDIDRCLRDLDVGHVRALVLTHFHADHVRGLRGVLRGRTVEAVIHSPVALPAAQAATTLDVLREARVPARVAQPGGSTVLGAWTLSVLGPHRWSESEESAANNASVILHARRGALEVVLLGDAELSAQRQLRSAHAGVLAAADVVKVAHHGSAVQDPALVAGLGASVALVPVGCDNRYGHPAPLTLQRHEQAGAVIARTDLHGDVAVVGEEASVRARGAGPTRGPASRC